MPTCEELIVGFAGGFINAAELMGYVAFDEAAAEACVSETDGLLEATPCAELTADSGAPLGGVEACDGLIEALQGEGEPCGIEVGGEEGHAGRSTLEALRRRSAPKGRHAC